MRITKYNWDEVMNNPPMKFEIFANGSYVPTKHMKKPDTNMIIQYIEPEDVVYAIEMRIKNQFYKLSSKAKKEREKWEIMKQRAEYLIGQKKMQEEQIQIQNSADDVMNRSGF